MDNSDIPFIIALREETFLKGCQERFPTIASFDARSFIDKNDDPLPDFKEIVWTGRKVFIAMGPGILKNRQVQNAEWDLGAILYDRSAEVIPLRFPSETNIADYLVRFGSDRFQGLIKECEIPPLTSLLREEYLLGSLLRGEGIAISRGFSENHPFYILRASVPEITIKIENLQEKAGKININISGYRNHKLLNIDRIDVISEIKRNGFIKRIGCSAHQL